MTDPIAIIPGLSLCVTAGDEEGGDRCFDTGSDE